MTSNQNPQDPHVSAKEIGDMALKFATDTAYAAAGFADMVAERAKEFVEKQRAASEAKEASVDAEAPAEGGEADPTKVFFDSLTLQVNKFVDDMSQTYKDLSDRGRGAVAKIQSQVADRADAPKGDDAPGPFDIQEGADAADPEIKFEGEEEPKS